MVKDYIIQYTIYMVGKVLGPKIIEYAFEKMYIVQYK